MAKLVSLVAVLGRINPAALDAVFPHGPVLGGRGFAHTPSSAPPLAAKDELLFASAAVAREIAFAALSAEASGNEGAARIITTAVDDWCGNGRPHLPIPWPGPWPFPWTLESAPSQGWDVAASRAVGALSLAAVAARVPPGGVRDALSLGAERLFEVAAG